MKLTDEQHVEIKCLSHLYSSLDIPQPIPSPCCTVIVYMYLFLHLTENSVKEEVVSSSFYILRVEHHVQYTEGP